MIYLEPATPDQFSGTSLLRCTANDVISEMRINHFGTYPRAALDTTN